MKIAFRVDSADSIGAGHIRRCLKLAEDLKNKSKKIYFITKNLTGNFNKLIDKKKFKVILIKNDTSKKRIISDWNSTKHICKKFKVNVLIADHYQLGINWEKKIKKCVNKLVVIDDFSKKEHYCDLIINNFSKKKNNYTKYYNGLEYVIIPSKILRQKTNNKTKSKFKKIGTFFGSSDSRNITEKFLKIFTNRKFSTFKFISILGKNNKNEEKIKINFRKYKNFNLIKSFKNIKNFFKQIDILISPGSVITFEALTNDIKCINVPLNFYQKMSSNFQQKNKIANTLNLKKILSNEGKKILINHFTKFPKKNNFSENKLYLDGHGSKRISEILIPSNFSEVSLKRAKNFEDCVDLFKLHNEEENIKNSFSQKKEKFKNHLKWFKKKILAKNSYIYVFRLNNLCVGHVRIDLIKQKVGLIDYSINKIFRGRGWGKLMLNRAMQVINKRNNISYFQAKVKKTNLKSIKIFRNLFFLSIDKKKYVEFSKSI